MQAGNLYFKASYTKLPKKVTISLHYKNAFEEMICIMFTDFIVWLLIKVISLFWWLYFLSIDTTLVDE